MSNPRIYMCAFVASHPLRQRTTSKIASYIVLDSAYVHVPSVFLPLLSCKSLPATSRPSTGEISLPPAHLERFQLQDGPYLTPAGAWSFPYVGLRQRQSLLQTACCYTTVTFNCQLAGAKCLDCSSLACLRSTPSGQEDAGFY